MNIRMRHVGAMALVLAASLLADYQTTNAPRQSQGIGDAFIKVVSGDYRRQNKQQKENLTAAEAARDHLSLRSRNEEISAHIRRLRETAPRDAAAQKEMNV